MNKRPAPWGSYGFDYAEFDRLEKKAKALSAEELTEEEKKLKQWIDRELIKEGYRPSERTIVAVESILVKREMNRFGKLKSYTKR